MNFKFTPIKLIVALVLGVGAQLLYVGSWLCGFIFYKTIEESCDLTTALPHILLETWAFAAVGFVVVYVLWSLFQK